MSSKTRNLTKVLLRLEVMTKDEHEKAFIFLGKEVENPPVKKPNGEYTVEGLSLKFENNSRGVFRLHDRVIGNPKDTIAAFVAKEWKHLETADGVELWNG